MLNHITVMGRLTRDPELRHTTSGNAVANFTVAVERDFSGGEKMTDFIECVAWSKLAEFISKYFHKGNMMVVDGRLNSRKWQDRDGNNRINWEIAVNNVYFAETRSSTREDVRGAYAPEFKELDNSDGKLPF